MGETTENKAKPVRRAIVAVQPKTIYSNERTFLDWIHFGTMLATIGIALLHGGGRKHVTLGRFLVASAILLVAWSFHIFNWRADCLDLKKSTEYHDKYGPPVLIFALLA